jgi:WhiB family redox-sensing transcriptional regulator
MDGSSGGRREAGWREAARCRDVEEPDVFFPDRKDRADEALALCALCPVLLACRRHALELPERFGVWGGLTEAEREGLLRASRARRPVRRPSVWVGLSRRRIGA